MAVLPMMGDIQRQAQSALPVIPNNGNPGGAHNMPRTGGMLAPDKLGLAPIQSRGYAYPWMEPSSAMEEVKRMLSERRVNTPQQQQPGQFNYGPLGAVQTGPRVNVGGVPHYTSGGVSDGPVMPQGVTSVRQAFDQILGIGRTPTAYDRDSQTGQRLPVLPTTRYG